MYSLHSCVLLMEGMIEGDPATLMQCAYSLYFVPILLQWMWTFSFCPCCNLTKLSTFCVTLNINCTKKIIYYLNQTCLSCTLHFRMQWSVVYRSIHDSMSLFVIYTVQMTYSSILPMFAVPLNQVKMRCKKHLTSLHGKL